MNADLLQKAESLPGEPLSYEEWWDQSRDIWPELVAEIKRLQAALVDSRAEYLTTLDENPACSAWTFDEQSPERQSELRKRACITLGMEEPVIFMQLAAKDAEIALLKVSECAAKKNLARRDADIENLMKELARWQEIAQDRTAQMGWITSCNCGRLPDMLKWDYCDWSRDIPQGVRNGWNAWAAKEL
ncbi:MAG: hypothetical protein WC455_31260, partial [Dehalococcoidia bacterium]